MKLKDSKLLNSSATFWSLIYWYNYRSSAVFNRLTSQRAV